jgi:hypothetical protein
MFVTEHCHVTEFMISATSVTRHKKHWEIKASGATTAQMSDVEKLPNLSLLAQTMSGLEMVTTS